jgi:hypothetical protein
VKRATVGPSQLIVSSVVEMTRKSRRLALAKNWYVSFVPEGGKVKRTAKTFETENEAKAFALTVLARGLTFSAGTLNPHLPKQAIFWADAKTWARSE